MDQVWQTLQHDRCFREPHDLQEERIEVECFLFRRARPAPIDLADLLYSNMTELVRNPLQRLSRPNYQRRVGVAQIIKHAIVDPGSGYRAAPRVIAHAGLYPIFLTGDQ